MAVPKLRFKADDGSDYPELTVAKLDDLCEKIGDGLHGTPIYSQTGNYYFINGNNLENGKIIVSSDTPKVNDGVFEKNNKELNDSTILMSINGTIGKVAYYNNEKVILGKSVAYFKVNYKCIKEYCYQLIQTANVQCQFQKGLTGSTIKNLGLNTIKNTNVKVPCLAEQQKIAEFLSTVDTVIEKQKETVSAWEERKKGVMQKLFSQEVRFKADDGSEFPEWEEKKIGDITLSHNAGIYIAKDNYGTGTNIIGVGDIYESDVINGKQYRLAPVDSDEYILDEGDLVYGESSLVPEGIARTVCVGAAGKGTAFAWHTRRYKVDSTIINPYFLTLQVNYAERVRNHLMRVCTRNALTGMTTNEYFGTKISVPCLAEQQKIADCLSSVDEVIEKQKATLSTWEELKKGLLQQMFV